MSYNPGSIKQNPANGDVALRTTLDQQDTTGGHNWICHTMTAGAWYCDDATVQNWADIYTA